MPEREDTRALLLATAVRLFGTHGYDGVTTRMLAEAAGANIAAIKYHFGSKDELYLGVIDHIVQLVTPRLDLVLSMAGQARSIASNDPTRQAVLVTQLVEAVLSILLRTPALKPMVPFVLRELFVPGPHFNRLYDAVPRRLHEALTDLVAWVLGMAADAPETIVRTHALVGQLVVFQIGRGILQRRLGIDDYGDAEIDLIQRQAGRSILMSLGLPTPDSDPAP